MRSCTFEYDATFLWLIDEKPIGLDMALPPPMPVSQEFVVPVERIQWFFRYQGTDDDLELLELLPTPLYPLDVSFELPCVYWSKHQILSFLNISSASSHTTR